MEEVGYIAETMACTRRQEAPEEGDEQGEGRRREGERTDDYDEEEGDEVRPSTLSTVPESSAASGERNARHAPVPWEEHLTAEDWAIMTAVENCVIWRC